MTAPARRSAARGAAGEREQREQDAQPSRARGGRAGSAATERRRAAAARASARREERRDRPRAGDGDRAARGRRQPGERSEPRRRAQRQATAQRAAGPRAARGRAGQQAVAQLHAKVVGSRVPFVVTVMSLLVGGLATTLWLSISAVSGSYELQQTGSAVTALNERKEQLQREVSFLNSVPVLERRAEQLGMVPGPEPARILVRPDGSIVLVGDPQAAVAPAPPVPPAPVPPSPVPAPPAVAGPPSPAPIPPAEAR